jgi:hypothetical protein
MGCKPVNIPDVKTIEPSQTAFLVPLEGETSKQASFDSEAFYEKSKVATKRVTITKRWRQMGRGWFNGEWIPEMRLLVVERKPETREWAKSSGPDSELSIKAESRESIGFSVGMNISAQIDEPDAVKFLYRYNNKPLKTIMDDEIRARIEGKFVEQCSKFDLTQLLLNKQQIMDAVRGDVIPYFKERGITVTVLGLKGGFNYDENIQKSIDAKFTAEQQKIAQLDLNAKNVSKAEADAKVAQLLANPQVRLLKQYELMEKQIDLYKTNWKGDMPNTLVLGSGSNNLFSALLNGVPK